MISDDGMRLSFVKMEEHRLRATHLGNRFEIWCDQIKRRDCADVSWFLAVNGEIVSVFSTEYEAKRAASMHADGFSARTNESRNREAP